MQRSRSCRLRKQDSGEPLINLTPLIDVVFVILIMFIVIAPLLELEQVQLASGPVRGRTTPAVQENSPVAIHVRADNSIWYKNRAVSPKQLTEQLTAAKRQYPKAVPQLFQDKKAQFGTYQTVKNGVEAAGYERLDLILNPG